MSSAIEAANVSLIELRNALRDLHKQLIEIAKTEYQLESQTEISALHLLQLLTEHAQFAWLHQLSKFMVEIDELLEQAVITHAGIQGIFSRAKSLISPQDADGSEFSQRYVSLLAYHPALTMAHANVRRILVAEGVSLR